MRPYVLLLLCWLALLRAAPVSAAPTVVGYSVVHTTLLRSYLPGGEPVPRWAHTFGLCLCDPEAVENIASVTILDPASEPMAGDATWIWAGGHGACVCIMGEFLSRPPDGTYTLEVHGWDGSQSGPIPTAPFHYPEPVPDITYPVPGSIILETAPLFEWLPYPGFACEGGAPPEWQLVDVSTPDETEWLWGQYVPVGETSVLYGGDPLEPGHGYTVHLWEGGPWTCVSSYPWGWHSEVTRRDVSFHVSGPPTILDYLIRHTTLLRSAYPDGEPYPAWARSIGVHVRDVSGPEAIAGVTVWDPAGDLLPSEAAFRIDQPDGSVCFCTPWEDASMPPVGSYTLVAHDTDGSDSEPVVTGSADHFPYPVPDIAYPAPGSVIADTVPLFEWPTYPGFACEGGAAAVCQLVEVSTPDETAWLWRQFLAPEVTSVLYGAGGDPIPPLDSGQSYTVHLWEEGPWTELGGDPPGFRVESVRRDSTFWVEPKFVGFLQPINDDGSSIFKLGSTVPVKFQLLNADGSYKADAVATLSIAKVENDIVGTYQEPVSTAAADAGSAFRYDSEANQYVFNLRTKGRTAGTYSLQVTVDGAIAKEVLISLR